ncbi:lipoprotein-releasing ABC transporter permease subunit [Colwellia asteriadis]|uniref:Lipoprotein-releasing ABC transporter permease subunit n=1 Tax=Colwellia asteriadis TaxID=517723 RepID=A0ABN1L9G2_9GAMM
MFQPISIFIGLRYSRSRSRTGFVSFITFFSIVGILLGVTSLITVVSVMNGFEGELKKRILGIVPHVVINDVDKVQSFYAANENNTQAKRLSSTSPSWQPLRQGLLEFPHVLHVSPFLESEALIQSPSGLQGVLMQGIEPIYEQNNIINQDMVIGSLNSLSEQPYTIVVGQSLARQLKVTLGDEVRLFLPNKSVFTPMGRIPVQRVFTVGGIFNVGSQVDESMVYVSNKYGAKLLRRKGDGIDKLRLYLDDAFHANTVVKQLLLAQQAPNNKQTPAMPQHHLASSLPQEITFSVWSESQGVLFSAVNMEKNMMWLMLSLIVAVAAFNIVSALVMVVIDKQGEIAILQTLGFTRAGVVKIFITQGMVNGLWGIILGSVFGVLLTLNLNSIITMLGVNLLGVGVQHLPVELVLSDVFTIVLSALAMSFIATLYPAYKASTTLPAEVLRNE